MAQNDVLKRYIDAGLAFTALTQARAEALVKDLVKVGEVQADQARDAVTDLLERSRKNSEKLLETVRTEVRQQITSLGLATQADLDRIEQRIASVIGTATAPAKGGRQEGAGEEEGSAPRRRPPKKAAAKKKAPAKRAPAKKSAEEGLIRWRAAASTPSWCDGAWRPAASRRRPTSRPGGSPSAARRRTRPARLVAPGEPIRVLGPAPRFVGRGGEKLDAALTRFAVAGRGAARPRPRRVHRRVHRLPPAARRRVGGGRRRRLRAAPRAAARRPSGGGPASGPTSATWSRATSGAPADLVVADLSFISLRTVLPAVLALTAPGADLVLLVKPQFEAGREEAARGRGVITDPDGVAAGARGGRCRARAGGSRHHGRHGLTAHRCRRQRGVPRCTPAPPPSRRSTSLPRSTPRRRSRRLADGGHRVRPPPRAHPGRRPGTGGGRLAAGRGPRGAHPAARRRHRRAGLPRLRRRVARRRASTWR